MNTFRGSTVIPGAFSTNGMVLGFLLLGGGSMQGYANGTVDAMFVGLLLLILGISVVSLVFPRRKPELQTFLLTYGICVFVGGVSQCYSLDVFDIPQSTSDSLTFFQHISAQPPFMTLASMPHFNSPLAVVIWQQVYKVTWWLGFDFGPYTAVMFNALVMGLTGSITVRTARELFGNDNWRLQRVGVLFAFCGLFILFGAILLRDSFTTLLNALVLWFLVRFLVRQSLGKLLSAIVVISVSAYAMSYLRLQAVVLFGLYGFLTFVFWFFARRVDSTRLLAGIFSLCVLLVASTYLLSYVEIFQDIQSKGMAGYSEFSSVTHSEESLGMSLIINQPLPIRVVAGSGALMVSPIPLWANFSFHSTEYSWIKGYHGIYQILVIPLVLVGFITCFRSVYKNRQRAIPLLFLGAYLIMNMLAVVVTSMEQRHFAQFMPAFMILAALPDTRQAITRKKLRKITRWWLAAVVVIHFAWAALK